jgi:TonB-dependent Receptor Plug Domain
VLKHGSNYATRGSPINWTMVSTDTFASVLVWVLHRSGSPRPRLPPTSLVPQESTIQRDSRQAARAPLTHTGNLLLIENLELLVDESKVPLDFRQKHILDGSRTALGAHIFPHQPPQVQRAHGSHHQRLEQRAIVAGTLARFGRGIDRLFLEASRGSEPSVAIYVDGAYMASSAAGLFNLNNVERVEVLKGPQGTLFGRNATGGVIQVITKEPSSDSSADLSVGYGNYNTSVVSFYGTGAVAAGLATDLAVYADDSQDGCKRPTPATLTMCFRLPRRWAWGRPGLGSRAAVRRSD